MRIPAQRLIKQMVREVLDHDRQARGLKPSGSKLYVENERPDWWPVQVRAGRQARFRLGAAPYFWDPPPLGSQLWPRLTDEQELGSCASWPPRDWRPLTSTRPLPAAGLERQGDGAQRQLPPRLRGGAQGAGRDPRGQPAVIQGSSDRAFPESRSSHRRGRRRCFGAHDVSRLTSLL